jgi:Permuted papain-like amidase enzyme, YaeF/YiiX, C92 family
VGVGVINLKPSEIKVGDIGFARTKGVLGRLIRYGEYLKFRSSDFNHTFIVVSTGATYDEIFVIQATLKGVRLDRLSSLFENASEIHIVAPPPEVNRRKIALFAISQIGHPYGLMSIACIGLDILTPDWFISTRRNGTWICSALTAEALRYAGWFVDWKDIYTVTPTGLWLVINR